MKFGIGESKRYSWKRFEAININHERVLQIETKALRKYGILRLIRV